MQFHICLSQLRDHGSNLTEEELETHTISAWKLGKRQRYGQLDVHGRPIEIHFVHVSLCGSTFVVSQLLAPVI